MKAKDLQNDPVVLDWFLSINSKGNTKRAYLTALQNFTDYTNKTPSELIKEAELEVKNGTLMRERSIRRYLNGFREHLEQQNLAPLTIKARVAGVHSFYKNNFIDIPILQKSGRRAKPLRQHCEIPTKNDIQEILRYCDPIEKAIVLVGVASGLSVNTIVNLAIADFKKGYDPETEITTLKLRREKVDYDFITFLTPEATKAVKDYMEYRNRKPKSDDNKRRREQLMKQAITSDKNYLFISRSVPAEYMLKKKDELRRLDEKAVMTMYRQISEKSQKSAEYGVWNLIRSHNIRKFFNSALLNAGADIFFVDYLMGHTLDSTHDAYFRASPEKLKEIYKKYIPFLTIQKELDVSSVQEFKDLLKENEELKAKLEYLSLPTAARLTIEMQEMLNNFENKNM